MVILSFTILPVCKPINELMILKVDAGKKELSL
jgi:hypothetical protein